MLRYEERKGLRKCVCTRDNNSFLKLTSAMKSVWEDVGEISWRGKGAART